MFSRVIFDLDGTLLDTLQDLANAGEWVCAQNGWPAHTTAEYKYFVGNGIPKLVERFSPESARTPDCQARTLKAFTERYAAHKADCTAPYPGIRELLGQLADAGVAMGVVTNKQDDLAHQVIAHYFGAALLPLVQGQTPALPTKPDPTGTLLLLDRLGGSGPTLFVGDSDVDIRTGRNAGLPTCGVLWGFRTRAELEQAGADYIARSPADLLGLIRGQAPTTGSSAAI